MRAFGMYTTTVVDGFANESAQVHLSVKITTCRLSAEHLTALGTDDGKAGCALGVALVLILLFGIAMAVATLFFTGAFGPGADGLPAG